MACSTSKDFAAAGGEGFNRLRKRQQGKSKIEIWYIQGQVRGRKGGFLIGEIITNVKKSPSPADFMKTVDLRSQAALSLS